MAIILVTIEYIYLNVKRIERGDRVVSNEDGYLVLYIRPVYIQGNLYMHTQSNLNIYWSDINIDVTVHETLLVQP